MNREKAKILLESFVYDNCYYKEKLKEVESFKDSTEKSLERIKTFKHNNFTSDEELNTQLQNIYQKQVNEENMLLNIILKKQKIEECIEKISQPLRTILYLKYIRFNTFDQIGDKLHYSTKRIYQLHSSALSAFADEYYSSEKSKEIQR